MTCVDDKDGSCRWERETETDNMVSVISLPQNGSMEVVGLVNGLGKKEEVITSVRFLREKAFLVTFRRTDPFYTLDLSDPREPAMAGELEIPGFSSYLHPYDEEGNYILAVGKNADEAGRITGTQVSLFNVTNFTDPGLVERFDIENEKDAYSYSEAENEHKAFRFFRGGNKLILPAVIFGTQYDFDGFYILNVTERNITLHFKVTHADSKTIGRGCWKNAHLPSRSVVHRGIVTTMKSHTVVAHDIDSKELMWETNLDSNQTKCYDYWWWRSWPL